MEGISLTDSHTHLWNIENFPYTWLDDLDEISKSHELEEYDSERGTESVEDIVFVECTVSFEDRVSREEVRWVSALSEKDERIRGIVAHASLERGAAVRSHLQWLSENPQVKGVRRILQNEPKDFFLQSSFVEGVQALSDFDFSFDLTINAPQLQSATELVDQCPEVEFILDHAGKPNIQEGQFKPWNKNLALLAQRPNVACKISGLLTEADPETWTQDQIESYIHRAIEVFGADGVLFGGDWPVLRLAADYGTWLDVLVEATESFSISEKRKFFRSNAMRVYQLE